MVILLYLNPLLTIRGHVLGNVHTVKLTVAASAAHLVSNHLEIVTAAVHSDNSSSHNRASSRSSSDIFNDEVENNSWVLSRDLQVCSSISIIISTKQSVENWISCKSVLNS